MKTSKAKGVLLTLACCLFAGVPTSSAEEAADFPPGAFTDGGRYSLSDFEGKVLVLFFYEQDCPSCRGTIPKRNEVVKQFRDKPVKFIAVAAGDSLAEAKRYAGGTGLMMPVYADPLSVMEKRYGQTISLRNIYQFRVIGPDGRLAGFSMEPAAIEKALASVKLKYDPKDFHAKVRPALERFEWNQYAAGMKALRPLLKSGDKAVAGSANKLLGVVKAEGEQWLADAEAAADGEPVKAYDLYAKAAATFTGDDLGKKATAGVQKLKADKAVKQELEARKAYEKLYAAMAQATPQQKPQVAKFAAGLAKKYQGTPTAEKAEALAGELGGG